MSNPIYLLTIGLTSLLILTTLTCLIVPTSFNAKTETIIKSSSQNIPSYGAIKETEVLVGVCAHPYDARTPYFEVDRYFDLMKDAGVKWIRIGMVQPKYSWEFEPFVEQAHKRGIKVLATLGPLIVGHDPNFTLADWETAVYAVMEIFGERVDAWHIWNEPNIKLYQIGYMDGTPERYFDMVKSAYNIIKTSTPAPGAVVAGGLAPEAGCEEWTRRYWELGAENYCDAYSFHMYNPAQDRMMNQIASITDPKPLWITEMGAHSLKYGLEGQATQLNVLETYFKENMEKCRIQKVFWYCWMDYTTSGSEKNCFGHPTSRQDFFGLVTLDLKPKPAYSIYQS